MKYHSHSYNDALAFVRTKRIIVCPNQAFVSQLMLLESCAFDISHLGEDVLNPNIDNPYDPYEEIGNERARNQRKAQRPRDAIPPWEREPAKWCEATFTSDADWERFRECVKAACKPPHHVPLLGDEAEVWKDVGKQAVKLAKLAGRYIIDSNAGISSRGESGAGLRTRLDNYKPIENVYTPSGDIPWGGKPSPVVKKVRGAFFS
jgi:hypothetical protein